MSFVSRHFLERYVRLNQQRSLIIKAIQSLLRQRNISSPSYLLQGSVELSDDDESILDTVYSTSIENEGVSIVEPTTFVPSSRTSESTMSEENKKIKRKRQCLGPRRIDNTATNLPFLQSWRLPHTNKGSLRIMK